MGAHEQKLRVAILGGRGIPANYSGFDTLIEELAVRLVAEHGFEVTVHCRRHYYQERPESYRGVRCVYLRAIRGKGLESIYHTNRSVLYSMFRRYDVVFIVDPANAPFCLPLKLKRVPVVFHTDGLGWKRSKWSGVARRYYKWVEKCCARVATALVTDARAMQSYYQREYGAPSWFIPYGADTGGGASNQVLAQFDLPSKGYYLVVARLEPENNTDLIVREFQQARTDRVLVVVGGARYPTDWSRALHAQASARVRFIGPVYDAQALNGLYQHSYAYLHGHEVGGTNPGLLRAMMWGTACLGVDVDFNREVIGKGGEFFGKEHGALARLISSIDKDEARAATIGRFCAERAANEYRWDAVAAGYAELFRRMATARRGDRSALQPEEVYYPTRFVQPVEVE